MNFTKNIFYSIIGLALIVFSLYWIIIPRDFFNIFFDIDLLIGIAYLVFGINILKVNKYTHISFIVVLTSFCIQLLSPLLNPHAGLGGVVLFFPIIIVDLLTIVLLFISLHVSLNNK